ncbi:MAG: CsgG/HfaB family protein [bacterium]
MKYYFIVLLTGAVLALPTACLRAQEVNPDSLGLVVAVLNFNNNTDVFAYEKLVNSIPEMLKTELSIYPDLVVVERQRIEKIMQEQALTLSGFLNEESAQQVGQLLGAQYILMGELNRINAGLRIDCHIISVETGQVKGEKIAGPGRAAFEKMLQLLASNIVHNLTGQGQFQSRVRLRNYPTRWFIVATTITAIATGITHAVSQSAYNSYQDATQLDDFDRFYNRANNFRKVRNGLIVATATVALTTTILWLKDRSQRNQIYATATPTSWSAPYFAMRMDGGLSLNWRVSF